MEMGIYTPANHKHTKLATTCIVVAVVDLNVCASDME